MVSSLNRDYIVLRAIRMLRLDPVDWSIDVLMTWKLNFDALEEGEEAEECAIFRQYLFIAQTILYLAFHTNLPL